MFYSVLQLVISGETGVYKDMDEWIELRRKIRNEQIPLRQLERETGIHRQTLRKIRDNSQPPRYRRVKPARKSKIGPYLERIKGIIFPTLERLS